MIENFGVRNILSIRVWSQKTLYFFFSIVFPCQQRLFWRTHKPPSQTRQNFTCGLSSVHIRNFFFFFFVVAFPAHVPPSQNIISRSWPPSPPPSICKDQTARPVTALPVNPLLEEVARQQCLDVPISSHQAMLGREAVCECKHSFLPAGLPSPTGPSVAFICLPKITIGFNDSLGMN